MNNFIQELLGFIQKILEGISRFIDSLLGNDKQEDKPEIARPVELGIASSEKPKYSKKQYVLTYREKILLGAIREAVEREYTILMKVRMGDFIILANEPEDRKFHNNQIQCKHVDFLLCSKFNIEPLLVIELDDSSHKNYDNAERDKFKDDTFTKAGLPFIRMKIQEKYDSNELRKQIQEKINPNPK